MNVCINVYANTNINIHTYIPTDINDTVCAFNVYV